MISEHTDEALVRDRLASVFGVVIEDPAKGLSGVINLVKESHTSDQVLIATSVKCRYFNICAQASSKFYPRGLRTP